VFDKRLAKSVNLVSAEDDPGEIQPHVGLDFFLMAAATQTVDQTLTDCLRDRDFHIRDLFPAKVLAKDDELVEPFLTPFLDAINPEILDAFGRVDCFPTIMDPLRCPSHLLDALLYHYGSPFTLEEGLNDNEKRRLLSVLFTLYSLKGTCFGIIGTIRILYGINVTECVEPNIQCWVLGESELNYDTFL
jgi:phage tail-like protein